jgi:N-acetylmuramoyl-L-alanine amidase
MNKNKALWVWALLVALACPLPSFAAAALVKAMEWSAGPRPRLTLELNATPAYHRVARYGDASQLAIDLGDTLLASRLAQPPASHPVALRVGTLRGKDGKALRFLVEVKQPAQCQARLEQLKDGARLVVEWAAAPKAEPAAVQAVPPTSPSPAPARPARSGASHHPFIVVIDAGHGGKDTGAIGPGGHLEKDVVLAIARKLAGFVHAEPGMKAVLVRRDDEFVDLRHRAAIARKARADLFVSIHADAYADSDVKGSSVFTLSDHGATSEAARWLADSENAALVGGPKLKDKDKLLASVLVDLSKNATLDASTQAAERVLIELKKSHAVHHPDVQKAGFAVLKSLDVPSMLVETAFISNPDEERRLCDVRYQEQVARAVFRGIRAYFAEQRPAGVRVAEVP